MLRLDNDSMREVAKRLDSRSHVALASTSSTFRRVTENRTRNFSKSAASATSSAAKAASQIKGAITRCLRKEELAGDNPDAEYTSRTHIGGIVANVLVVFSAIGTEVVVTLEPKDQSRPGYATQNFILAPTAAGDRALFAFGPAHGDLPKTTMVFVRSFMKIVEDTYRHA